MRRRKFLTLLGAAATWPVVAGAQQPTAMPVIGFVRSTAFTDALHYVTAFRLGLEEAGYVEGRNVAIEYRSAEDHQDRLAALVAELIRRPVAVFVREYPCGVRGQGRDYDGPDRFCNRGRPGPGWLGGQPQPAGRQRH